MQLPYSNIGRTIDLYRYERHFSSALPKCLYRKPRNYLALVQMLVMCVDQDRSLEIVTPR